MAAIGGSIESISIRGRLFPVPADADVNRKVGGFETEIQANGDGSARKIMTRVPWMLDGITVEIDEDRADHEFLQEIADDPGYVAITITYASGATWQARGTISGELQVSSQNATASFSMGGPGAMTQQ
jgi:hypothetical protein